MNNDAHAQALEEASLEKSLQKAAKNLHGNKDPLV